MHMCMCIHKFNDSVATNIWGAEGQFFLTFEQKSSYYVFIDEHKQPQLTCQADTITDSSLTPSVALLVYPSGTVRPIVDCHH